MAETIASCDGCFLQMRKVEKVPVRSFQQLKRARTFSGTFLGIFGGMPCSGTRNFSRQFRSAAVLP